MDAYELLSDADRSDPLGPEDLELLAASAYYLVSIVPNRQYIQSREPVEKTVLVDARERTIVEVFDHNDPESDDRLRAFFDGRSATAGKPATATTG